MTRIGKRKKIWYGAAAAFFLLAGCCFLFYQKRQDVSASRQLFAMDTVMSFEAHGRHAEEAVEEAVKEVQRLESLFSTEIETSEIFALNKNGQGDVSEDTLAVIKEALRIHEETGGLFDLSVYPLMKLWGFAGRDYHVPPQEEIDALLPEVDASKIAVEGNHVVLGEGRQIDLGGIAKGYASGRIMEIFKEYGIKSGLVSLGGNVQAAGAKADGSKWRIGIRDPEGEQGEIIGVLQMEDKAVITSGGYERYFEEDGKKYIHILDPRTGYPAGGDLSSVTVVSEDGMLADALSTSLYLMGFEKAKAYWEEHREEFDMILITEDREIFVTDGIGKDFSTEEKLEVLQG